MTLNISHLFAEFASKLFLKSTVETRLMNQPKNPFQA